MISTMKKGKKQLIFGNRIHIDASYLYHIAVSNELINPHVLNENSARQWCRHNTDYLTLPI